MHIDKLEHWVNSPVQSNEVSAPSLNITNSISNSNDVPSQSLIFNEYPTINSGFSIRPLSMRRNVPVRGIDPQPPIIAQR